MDRGAWDKMLQAIREHRLPEPTVYRGPTVIIATERYIVRHTRGDTVAWFDVVARDQRPKVREVGQKMVGDPYGSYDCETKYEIELCDESAVIQYHDYLGEIAVSIEMRQDREED